MKASTFTLLTVIAAAAAVTGCKPMNPEGDDSGQARPTGQAARDAAKQASVEPIQDRPSSDDPLAGTLRIHPRNTLVVSPDVVPECGKPIEATIRWDVRAANPQTRGVEIWLGTDGKLNLFGQTATYGEAKTGVWNFPGSLVILKDQESGQEIGRLRMGGPKCG